MNQNIAVTNKSILYSLHDILYRVGEKKKRKREVYEYKVFGI